MVTPARSGGGRVGDRARHADPGGLLQDLVVPEGLVVRMKEEMRVSLDEPRDQRRPRELHSLGARRHFHAGSGTGCDDPLAADDDDPAAHRGLGDAVPHGRGDENDRSRGVGCRGLLSEAESAGAARTARARIERIGQKILGMRRRAGAGAGAGGLWNLCSGGVRRDVRPLA